MEKLSSEQVNEMFNAFHEVIKNGGVMVIKPKNDDVYMVVKVDDGTELCQSINAINNEFVKFLETLTGSTFNMGVKYE